MGTSVVAYGVIFSRSFIVFLVSRGSPAGKFSILPGYRPGSGICGRPVKKFLTSEVRFPPNQRSPALQGWANKWWGFGHKFFHGRDLVFPNLHGFFGFFPQWRCGPGATRPS